MTEVLPLARTASDHVPCVVTIKTSIPKSNLFRFENYWLELEGFMDCVAKSWNIPSRKGHITAKIADNFKSLRMCLKIWQLNVSKLKLLIAKCNHVIFLLDDLEEWRPLFVHELNFRKIVKVHLEKLLHLQFLYWKKRCTVRYIKVGEEIQSFSMPWPLKGTREILLQASNFLMALLSMIMLKWKESSGIVLKTEWPHLEALSWALTSLLSSPLWLA